MVATQNRVATALFSLLLAAVVITACSPPGPAALMKGKRLLDAGRMDDAIVELRTAVTLMQTNAAAWNYLGVAYHRAGLLTNAVEAYSQALRFNRELLEARFNLGCVLLDQNKPDAAKTEFTAFTLRRPNVIEGFVKLGTAQMRMRDLAGAEKSFREALKLNDADVEALNALGMVAAQLNRPRDAADAFTKALKQQPDHRPALLNLATVQHHQLNDPAEALKRYREYLALQPRETAWEAVSAIAKSLEPATTAPAQPRSQPAAQSNTPAPNSNGSRNVAATTKPAPQTNAPKPTVTTPSPAARLVQTQTAPPPAPEIVKLAADPVIKTAPEDSRVVPTSSVATDAPAKPAVVNATDATRGISGTSPTREARPGQKGLLSKLNPFKRDAKADATPVAIATPVATTTSPGAANNSSIVAKAADRRSAEQALATGQQLQRAGKRAEALQFYKRATSLDENYFEAQYSLGLAAFESRSFKVASTAWEKAIAIRPDSADARYNFALTLKAEGRFQNAADELEKLLALHPDEARGHLTLGNLYAEHLRNTSLARTHYDKVLQLDPRNPQAQAIRYWLVANPG
jgi:tetratricopeptide (TPR) repeat protein